MTKDYAKLFHDSMTKLADEAELRAAIVNAAADIHMQILEPYKRVVEALRLLLASRNCISGNVVEIPEEISGQFDIPLADAREIAAALRELEGKE